MCGGGTEGNNGGDSVVEGLGVLFCFEGATENLAEGSLRYRTGLNSGPQNTRIYLGLWNLGSVYS